MHYLDISIIVFFFIGISFYGIFQSTKNKSLQDFFLAGKNVSWPTAMFSIVATETSVLTFISVPGIAYRGDWTFLQLALGYIFGRILVSLFLIPLFFKYGITSIYEILAKEFNVFVQRLASITFLFTRVLADGVRFAAIAIIIQSITSWSITLSILIVGFVTLIYTVSGGLKAIIHIDAFRFIIYLVSAVICIASLLMFIDMPIASVFSSLNSLNKTTILDFSGNIFTKPFMFFSAFIGGTMLSFASHGADYMMVQRILATKDISSAKKAMIGSGIFVFIQFSLFLLIGSLIYIATDCMLIEKDREISYVILNILPIGLKGIVIAGILSAAMSTLSSSINSLSSSLVKDWFPNLKSLKVSRGISLFWTVILIGAALIFQSSNEALVIVGLKIASFTYGSLLSFFILSKFKQKFETIFVVIGYVSGIITVFYFIQYEISWTFYIIGSVISNISVVIILHMTKNINFIRYIFIVSILVLFFPLFSKNTQNDYNSLSTQIIDLKVKNECSEDKIYMGFDIFKENYDKFLNIMNVGIVVNHTSNMISVDEVNKKITTNLLNTHLYVKMIFTPEHGLNNQFQAGEKILGDIEYNIPVISLYGEKMQPDIKDLQKLDAVIFDIQDIGSRYYTYVSTMTNVMKACAKADIPLIIFDRPNPLSGKIGGPVLDMNFSSFVGMHPIPIRHGMTIGELAYMINDLGWLGENLKADLRIMKMQGWSRNMYFEETGLKWIPPSPNIPDNQTSFIYNGMCLIEGTNLSEGRGTDWAFKQFGAPWLNADKLVDKLNSKNLKGVSFNSVDFIPRFIPSKATYPKFKDKLCKGVRIEVKDKSILNPLHIAIYILNEVYLLHPEEFKFLSNNFIDKLFGSDKLRNYILSDKKVEILMKEWEYDQETFKEISSNFLLY